MTKRQGSQVPSAIERLLKAQGSVTAGAVSRAAGVTRQAAYYHLRAQVRAGRLTAIGSGRGARYVPTFEFQRVLPIEGLREDAIWSVVTEEVHGVSVRAKALTIARFAFTEMLNNAIDHSGGTEVEIAIATQPMLELRVADDGVGAFAHFRDRLGLPDEFAAAFEITKGKRTTAPAEHSGQGIFFTSRLVDRFGLESNGLRLTVDSNLADLAIGDSSVQRGTTVWWEIDPATERESAAVIAPYTDAESLEFTRTRVHLRLLGGPSFISRAEAKRVADQLERFEEAEIDFTGVDDVGQGFVDELFRVWATRHPQTRLIPISMSPAVERMVRLVAPPADSGGRSH